MADTASNYDGKPMWVRNQRNSWHGVDFPYHSTLDIAEYYRRYAETLLAVDESLGRITALLAERHMLDDTLVIFMGDNGFAFGEHGLIDKRTAYESSMRVPLVMAGAGLPVATTVSDVVANIDIAPSILDAAGLTPPAMDGRSFLPLARGERVAWREALLYQYYWERNFPQTPTIHAVRGTRYKYIRYYGLWDTDELYDLIDDPAETRNLVRDPARSGVVKAMNGELFDLLAATGGMYIPLAPDRGAVLNLRRRGGSTAADFPASGFRSREHRVTSTDATPAASDALVFFGATGDLAYKKIFPALQGMAKHGTLSVPVIGVAGSGWTPRPAARAGARQREEYGGGVDAAAFAQLLSLLQYIDGDYADPATFTRLRAALGGAKHAHALPRDSARPVRQRVIAQLERVGLRRRRPCRRREAVRPRPGDRPRAQRVGPHAVSRVVHLPHRPLPRQGSRREPAVLPVRQHLPRADLEPPLRGQRADHDGRGVRHQRARQVLRPDRRDS